ncbi:MAG: hypothetical protein ABJO30_05760 [Hyphomicrobiales bacterium]
MSKSAFSPPNNYHLASAQNPLDSSGDLVRAFLGLLCGTIVIATAVSGHIVSPIFAIGMTIILIAAMARWMPETALIAVLIAMIFQNTFVALVSPSIDTTTSFNIVRGYNFLILCGTWGISVLMYLFHFKGQNSELDRLSNVVFILLGIIGVYFLIGFVQNPLGAVIYLRSVATAVMLFHVCLIIFGFFKPRFTPVMTMITLAIILIGYVELFFVNEWNRLINGESFWNLTFIDGRNSLIWDRDARERGIVVKSIFDVFTVDLFNTPLLADLKISIRRLLGPNLHPISFAYIIGFFLAFSLYRGKFILAALLLPLLIFTNAKGPIILLVLVSFAWIAAQLFGHRFAFFSLLAAVFAYICLGVIVGLSIGDYHVLGFMGGVYNFFEFPIGRGIGTGGNLATNFAELDWSAYQAAGRTPIAIESAVGVLLYQLGFGAFLYLGICGWFAWKTVQVGAKTGQSVHLVAGFMLLVILANGVFQEEALFSPLAFGFIMAFNGMILGAYCKAGGVFR